MSSTPRSDFLRRVLGALRDHPHDDTVERISKLLAMPRSDIAVALTALEEEGLVGHARSHWMLSHEGWATARADDPYDGLE